MTDKVSGAHNHFKGIFYYGIQDLALFKNNSSHGLHPSRTMW